MARKTELKAALDESRQRYQAIFQQAAVGIGRVAPDGHWLEMNQRLCEIVGYSHEELYQLTFQQLTHPDDLEESISHVEGLLSGKQDVYSVEKRYIRKSGETIWVHVTGSLVRKPSGEPDYLVAIVQDIQERVRVGMALRESERRYRAVLESSRDGFWTLDRNGKLLEINDIYCHLSGYTRDELLSMSVDQLDASENPQEIAGHIDKVIRDGGDVFVTRHRRKNGELWPVEVTVTWSDLDGGHFFSILRDIRDRFIAHEMLKLRQRISDITYHGTLEQVMQTALDAAEELTDSKIGFFHFVAPDQQNLSLQVWSTHTLKTFCFAEGKGFHYAVSEAGVWVDCILQRQPVIHNDYASLPHKKGLPEGHAPVIRELTVPIFRDQLIVAVIGVGNKEVDYTSDDITLVQQIGDLTFDYVERKRAESQVQYMAYYDVLTGLPNRELLFDRLNQAIAHVKRSENLLALAYLDLDGFKPVNDQHGHQAGDQLLIAFAQRLGETLREGDTIARLGGDEFALVLTELPHTREAETIIERILEIVRQPFSIVDQELHISASIGYTLYPIDDSDADSLLRHADQAMYQAKSQGKNTYHLYDATEDKSREIQHKTLAEIRHALDEDEFVLFFQPKVDMLKGEVIGVEALIRWQHPNRGLLNPADFLYLLDGGEEEIRLGEWVILHAMKQLTKWKNNGVTLPISVNISPNQLRQPSFLAFVRSTLAKQPAEIISRLEIEVLESASITDFTELTEAMEECTGLGIRFALDDFGTGYSSLTYFHRLPIHLLKIDQQFICGMLDSAEDLAIVEGVVRLAQAYDTPIIAEGVESLELGALLLDLGCNLAQGYGIAHPMSAERIGEWLHDWAGDRCCQDLLRLDSHSSLDMLLQIIILGHHRWIDSIRRFIESGGESERPVLSPEHCGFARWYRGLGRVRYGNRPGYPFLAARHRTMHLLGGELSKLVDGGHPERAIERLAELDMQKEEFSEMIRGLSERKPA